MWCNGSTSDFGSDSLGSNPGTSTESTRLSPVLIMNAIDKPNTLYATPGYGRSRLFFPFKYKQDDRGCCETLFLKNDFIRDRTSTFEFEHTVFTMPYMR